jgi:hypothetical protein
MESLEGEKETKGGQRVSWEHLLAGRDLEVF